MENEKMDRDVEKILTTIKKFSRINQWSKIDDSSQIQCARFSFGFVNDIIRCSICPDAKAQLFDVDLNQTIDDVVFKFFAEFDWLGIDRTELAMINTVVSQEGISPKLIYFDKNCQVNEFIKSHTYCYEDDCDEETVRKLASLLAHLHSLIDIPISDDGHTRLEKIWSDDTSGLWDSNQIIDLVRTKMNESQLERYVSISTIDVKECRTFLRQLISKIDSPLVFSHNDFNRGNRLVQCDESENKRIYLVDFDYANYFARGQDIGRYFSNYRHKDDMFGDEGFPTDQQMDLFIEEYRKELLNEQPTAYNGLMINVILERNFDLKLKSML
ncbi:Choline/ethanolamine kinase [Sarcoptes scabiei]|uniref:Choline/ethanolamine kinase n=1 Tax=Sarcoptes scabiei TaxID=52283 RepID=A0A834RGQ6_SARSC|nr:Choline/ethanolamine kinase [Sarcoptes scabiei]